MEDNLISWQWFAHACLMHLLTGPSCSTPFVFKSKSKIEKNNVLDAKKHCDESELAGARTGTSSLHAQSSVMKISLKARANTKPAAISTWKLPKNMILTIEHDVIMGKVIAS